MKTSIPDQAQTPSGFRISIVNRKSSFVNVPCSIKIVTMGLGRVLILLGLVLIVCGVLLSYTQFFTSIGFGRLPGDIRIRRGNFSFYFPLTTCIILSVLLTLICYIFRK